MKIEHLKLILKEIVKGIHEGMYDVDYFSDDDDGGNNGNYGGWLDPNLKFHSVPYEQHKAYAIAVLRQLNVKYTDAYEALYKLGFIRVVFSGDKLYYRNRGSRIEPFVPISQKAMKELKDLAIEHKCSMLHDCDTGKITSDLMEVRESMNEQMFPREFDRNRLGSCMAAAELTTKYLLSKSIKDFTIVEGWVAPDGDDDWDITYKNKKSIERGNVFSHTWIKFKNGKTFDPTKKQWKHWGFNPDDMVIVKIRAEYTPEEYLDLCEWEPSPWTDFKKPSVNESTAKEQQVKSFLSKINDDNIVVTINRIDELPEASFVQVDGVINGHNVFSSNPEDMTKWGFPIPSSKQLLDIFPKGRYKLKDIKSKLNINEDMSYDDLLKLTTPERKEKAAGVNVRSLPVSTENNNEQWNFRYKSSPQTTVTDKPFRGSISFLKEVGQNDDASKMMCKVDCECPDFKYRFAYNDAAKGASQIGPNSLNKATNTRPKPAYDLGEGLCKHLTALGRFLKTKIQTTQTAKKSNLFETLNDITKQGPFNVTYKD